ncbi:ATP-binding protein [Agromyces sp. NPDC058136]|uniref:ATP-binding protein n=1 Tax=Agromyces sp. NPDC058136 TaxID=3346354 RepID=UPI0036DB2A62
MNVVDEHDDAEFTFSWLALKLLGRGLYSNPWSALSELVANGLDAGAKHVYVFIDAEDKSSATVEVIDDGSGMSRADIETYVKVGHNKRKDAVASQDPNPKGRKGIGKLAALFLSQHFFLRTSHVEGVTSWELDAREGAVNDEDHPKLRAVTESPSTPNDELWESLSSGTRITMLDVDLTGYGAQSMSALGSRLANQFLLATDSGPEVLLYVRNSTKDGGLRYLPVEKAIAFRNFADVARRFGDRTVVPAELVAPLPMVGIPAKGLVDDVYRHQPALYDFPQDEPDDEAWDEIKARVNFENQTYDGTPYSLTGWIGVHATIEMSAAKENDARFVRNKFYNPAQIRVYVRGKLASDRLLAQLGLADTYANYIEGELTFDLLDDDDLPDIATSNRQDFDETDGRITLLRGLVRPIVRSLVQRRRALATEIARLEKAEKVRRGEVSKRNFVEQVRNDFAQHPDVPEATSNALQQVIANKVQGDIELKDRFLVFISHSSKDELFASFIDEVLKARGAFDEEIFYTSRTGSTTVVLDDRALSDLIKESITDANTLIFYLTSKNFMGSQYCLFEGGAGWATRSVSEYLKLNVDYGSIPAFLTNGKSEASVLPGNEQRLTPELHNYLIEGIFNPMISHLNRGREVSGEDSIEPFVRPAFPTPLDIAKSKVRIEDHYDEMIAEHWEYLVTTKLAAYVASYSSPKP